MGKKNVTSVKEVQQQGCDTKTLAKDYELNPVKPGQNKTITFYCRKNNCNTKAAMEQHLNLKAGAAQISFAVATIVLGVVINRLTL